jgi:hypothetical protein
MFSKVWEFLLPHGMYAIADRARPFKPQIGPGPLEGVELGDDLLFHNSKRSHLIEIFFRKR